MPGPGRLRSACSVPLWVGPVPGGRCDSTTLLAERRPGAHRLHRAFTTATTAGPLALLASGGSAHARHPGVPVTLAPDRRTLLPLVDLAHARGKRSPVTCALKCGNACTHPVPNESDNDYFPDVAATRAEPARRPRRGRRGRASRSRSPRRRGRGSHGTAAGPRSCAFDAIAPVPAASTPSTVPAGYAGTPSSAGATRSCRAPRLRRRAPDRGRAGEQFGYNNDFLDVLPLAASAARGRCSWPTTSTPTRTSCSRPTTDPAQVDADKRTAIAAHGLSVVELKRSQAPAARGAWTRRRGSTAASPA